MGADIRRGEMHGDSTYEAEFYLHKDSNLKYCEGDQFDNSKSHLKVVEFLSHVDLPQLANQLAHIASTAEHDGHDADKGEIERVRAVEAAARRGDRAGVAEHLNPVGKWAL